MATEYRHVKDHYGNMKPGIMAVYRTFKKKDELFLGTVQCFMGGGTPWIPWAPGGIRLEDAKSRGGAARRLSTYHKEETQGE